MSENEIRILILDLVNSSIFQQLAKKKRRAIITIEEPNVNLVYASENVKVSIIENEEEESSKTGMQFFLFFLIYFLCIKFFFCPNYDTHSEKFISIM